MKETGVPSVNVHGAAQAAASPATITRGSIQGLAKVVLLVYPWVLISTFFRIVIEFMTIHSLIFTKPTLFNLGPVGETTPACERKFMQKLPATARVSVESWIRS